MIFKSIIVHDSTGAVIENLIVRTINTLIPTSDQI